jgi:hypothetical protein
MGDIPAMKARDDSLSALDQVSAWLTSLQVPIAKNRLSIYRKVLLAAEDRGRAGAGREFTVEAANAFHEVGELYQVWRGLKSIDDPILRQKLQKVVTGRAMLLDERPGKNEPRNTLFELLIASYLKFCGVKIQFRDPDDVVARIRHTQILIECKRIQSAGSFEENFNKATKQLIRNLANESSAESRGVIAVHISKTQNTGNFEFQAKSGSEVRERLTITANQFCWTIIKLFKKPITEKIVAAIVYFRVPWTIGSDVTTKLNSQFVQLLPLNQNADRNKRIFDTLKLYLTRLDPNMTERI